MSIVVANYGVQVCTPVAYIHCGQWAAQRSKGSIYDKVAQLVRCRTSSQRFAGSIPGHSGHFGRSWAKQFIPYCFSLSSCKWVPSINKAVLRVCALYAASCSGISPGGLKWSPCVQCLLMEEGRVSTSVDTRLYTEYLYLYIFELLDAF